MPVLRPMTPPEYAAWLAATIPAFGHNTGAQALYSRLGYQPTNISLFKPIGLTVDRPDEPSRTEGRQVLAVEDEYVAAEVDRDEDALRRLVDGQVHEKAISNDRQQSAIPARYRASDRSRH